MIQQSDIEGRLRLLRYGLIVLVVTTFLVALFVPFAYVRQIGGGITDFLGTAVIATIVVAVLGAVIYFGYSTILRRNAGES